MNKEVKEIIQKIEDVRDTPAILDDDGWCDNWMVMSAKECDILLDYINQLETNIKDSIESHKETIQDTKDFYRSLEDTIYSGSTLIELAETHIEILERGKDGSNE